MTLEELSEQTKKEQGWREMGRMEGRIEGERMARAHFRKAVTKAIESVLGAATKDETTPQN